MMRWGIHSLKRRLKKLSKLPKEWINPEQTTLFHSSHLSSSHWWRALAVQQDAPLWRAKMALPSSMRHLGHSQELTEADRTRETQLSATRSKTKPTIQLSCRTTRTIPLSCLIPTTAPEGGWSRRSRRAWHHLRPWHKRWQPVTNSRRWGQGFWSQSLKIGWARREASWLGLSTKAADR